MRRSNRLVSSKEGKKDAQFLQMVQFAVLILRRKTVGTTMRAAIKGEHKDVDDAVEDDNLAPLRLGFSGVDGLADLP